MSGTAKNLQSLIPERKPAAKVELVDEETGIKQISFRASESAKRELYMLAARQGRTRQALLIEAMNDLFTKYGLNSIA
jgi:hypothetical protein